MHAVAYKRAAVAVLRSAPCRLHDVRCCMFAELHFCEPLSSVESKISARGVRAADASSKVFDRFRQDAITAIYSAQAWFFCGPYFRNG